LKHVVVRDENELDQIIQMMPPTGTICPIFKVSNVWETSGNDLLKKFLLKLSLNGSHEI
jgi:GTPase